MFKALEDIDGLNLGVVKHKNVLLALKIVVRHAEHKTLLERNLSEK